MILLVWNTSGLGVVGKLLASRPNSPTLSNSRRLANDFLEQFDSSISAMLPRQSGLRPRVLVGAQRRVRRGPSLGDLTPAGARNSQDTLHALQQRPTDDDGVVRRLDNTPAFAVLPPSESNVVRNKIKSKTNC